VLFSDCILNSCELRFFSNLSMAEMLANLWGKFSLMEEESLGVLVEAEELDPLLVKGKVCAVGKILADRVIPKDSYKGPLSRVWREEGNISFTSLGENLFIVEFDNEWDKARVLEGRPWLFDGFLVSIVDFDGTTPLSKMNFDKAAFWIRMYNLPLACMGKEIGHKIGSLVGHVEEVDVSEGEAGWGEFLRVRVMVDVSKPLARGQMLHLKEQSLWIAFKYEQLPRFCFHCGVIRHGKGGCSSVQNRTNPGNETDYPYGQWLRVSYPNRRGGKSDQVGKNKEYSGKKNDQNDCVFSVHNGGNGLGKIGGVAENGGCSSLHGALNSGGLIPNLNRLIMGEQVYGGDLPDQEGSGSLVNSRGLEEERVLSLGEGVRGKEIEMTSAEKVVLNVRSHRRKVVQGVRCVEDIASRNALEVSLINN
jgi:hypothetical protein